jgi:hypothetical protein
MLSMAFRCPLPGTAWYQAFHSTSRQENKYGNCNSTRIERAMFRHYSRALKSSMRINKKFIQGPKTTPRTISLPYLLSRPLLPSPLPRRQPTCVPFSAGNQENRTEKYDRFLSQRGVFAVSVNAEMPLVWWECGWVEMGGLGPM